MKKFKVPITAALVSFLVAGGICLTGCGNSSTNKDTDVKQETKTETPASPKEETVSAELAKELYDKAFSLHWQEGFEFSEKSVELTSARGDKGPFYEVKNFNKIADAVFSKEGRTQFIDSTYTNTFVEKDGKVYRMEADRGGNITYISTELISLKLVDDKMYYVAKSRYAVDEFEYDKIDEYKGKFEYKENLFVLIKENGKWLVNNFTLPN